MLNQYDSMIDGGRTPASSTALLPVQTDTSGLRADPCLQERVNRAAAASGTVPPFLIPGAAALVLPVSLPLKTHRQRRAALPFAVEPHLSEPLDQVSLALGPRQDDQTWICVAMNRALLCELTRDAPEGAAVFPDTLAVPLPEQSDAWALWCGPETLHVRLGDGTGLAVARDAFATAWRAFGTPRIEIMHGEPPPGLEATAGKPGPLEPGILGTDLKSASRNGGLGPLRGFARFAAGVALLAGLIHVALLRADAGFLAGIVEARTAVVQGQLDARGIQMAATAPASLLEEALFRASARDTGQDPFLTVLAQTLSAMPPQNTVTFRDLRFDADSGTLTVMLAASGLQALQMTENALYKAGLRVASGAATRNEAGAEMQLVIGGGA